jgi:hypothetical protein
MSGPAKEDAMHIGYAEIELTNPCRPRLAAVRVRARAGTGAVVMCIPAHVALRLALPAESQRELTLADGRKLRAPYVGPIHVAFGDRGCFVGALVLGEDVQLGEIAMQDLDLVIPPSGDAVTVDPQSPEIPRARV